MSMTVRGGMAGLVLAGLIALLAGPASGGADKGRWKGLVPDEAYKQLLEHEAKLVQEKLKSKEEDDHKRAAIGALMIMGYATLHAKPDAKTEATAGLAQDVLNAAVKGKLDEARKLAANLGSAPATKSAAKRDWAPALETADIMNPLKTMNKGGDGIHPDLQVNIRLKGTQNGVEEKLRNLAAKKLTEATMNKTSKELSLLAYRMAVLGEIVYEYAPKKKTKDWQDLSLAMRNAGLELAQAAQKKDIDAVFQAGNKLNSSCNQCHSEFRLK